MQSYIAGSRVWTWIMGLMVIVCLSGVVWAVQIDVTSGAPIGHHQLLDQLRFRTGSQRTTELAIHYGSC